MTADVVATDVAPTRASSSRAPRRWLLRPPGVLFYLAVGFAVAEGIWVSSIQSFGGLMFTMLLWYLLAAIWAARAVGAAIATRLRFARAEWIRWLGVPLIMGVTYFWTQTGAPFDLRLAWSRTAMDQVAAEVMAGGTTDRDWIGLWPAEDVERLPGGMRFIVADCGLADRCGFAYSASGSISGIDPDNPNDYERLDEHWFTWTDRF
jgi:hypothetical protein